MDIPYKKVFIFLIILGAICLFIEISRNTVTCPQKEVVTRYIPRTFEEEQNEPVFVSDIFKTMFSQPGVWEAGLGSGSEETRKAEEINKYFISQT